MDMYDAVRPNDINLTLGIGNKNGVLEYMEADVFSSFNPEKFAGIKAYCKKHNIPYRLSKSKVRKLTDVLDEYKDFNTIHILKIDVENFETEVLEGLDFNKYKPWVICIEAVQQFTAEPEYSWESILLDAGYTLACSVSSNRYYVSDEHKDLPRLNGNSEEISRYFEENYVIYKPKELEELKKYYKIWALLTSKPIWTALWPARKLYKLSKFLLSVL